MVNNSLPDDISYAFRICEFISCCRQLLPFIEDRMRKDKDKDKGDERLPSNVVSLICSRLSVPSDIVHELWVSLRDTILSEGIRMHDRYGGRIDASSEDVSLLHSLSLRESSSAAGP